MKLFESARVEKLAVLFLFVASVLVGLQAVNTLRGMFDPLPVLGSVITVEGFGSVTAVPDIALITFTVSEEALTAEAAQDVAAQKVNTALALLKELNIEEKDIATRSYNVSPKYTRPQPCFNGFCPDYEQRIVGYTTSQTVAVKVRDTAVAGDVLSQLGGVGVNNLSGPSFTVDDPDLLKEEAREKAIRNAREKAETLAKNLNVRLVRTTGFFENTGRYPTPYLEKGFGTNSAVGGTVPELPAGEQEVAVSVSISYEIR